jgi:hypothetical protein
MVPFRTENRNRARRGAYRTRELAMRMAAGRVDDCMRIEACRTGEWAIRMVVGRPDDRNCGYRQAELENVNGDSGR